MQVKLGYEENKQARHSKLAPNYPVSRWSLWRAMLQRVLIS